MPVVCKFRGIKIYVYWRDHAPPHVHVKYAGKWVVLAVADGRRLEGGIHPLALVLVREWMADRHDQLMAAWEKAAAGKNPGQISPPSRGRKAKRYSK